MFQKETREFISEKKFPLLDLITNEDTQNEFIQLICDLNTKVYGISRNTGGVFGEDCIKVRVYEQREETDEEFMARFNKEVEYNKEDLEEFGEKLKNAQKVKEEIDEFLKNNNIKNV